MCLIVLCACARKFRTVSCTFSQPLLLSLSQPVSQSVSQSTARQQSAHLLGYAWLAKSRWWITANPISPAHFRPLHVQINIIECMCELRYFRPLHFAIFPQIHEFVGFLSSNVLSDIVRLQSGVHSHGLIPSGLRKEAICNRTASAGYKCMLFKYNLTNIYKNEYIWNLKCYFFMYLRNVRTTVRNDEKICTVICLFLQKVLTETFVAKSPSILQTIYIEEYIITPYISRLI